MALRMCVVVQAGKVWCWNLQCVLGAVSSASFEHLTPTPVHLLLVPARSPVGALRHYNGLEDEPCSLILLGINN